MPNGGNGAVRQRINFSKIPTVIKIPNLIEVQRMSYERFLQMNLLPSEREDVGLQAVFNSVFPITDFRGIAQLDFVDYSIGNWECKCGSLKGLHHLRSTCKNCGHTVITDPFKVGEVLCTKCGTFNKNVVTFCNKCGDPVALQLKYDVTECQERGMTFAAPLKVTIRLTLYDKDPDTGHKSIRDIKEQEVYFGEIPLMTENGTFIVNGTERVIVSQLHRSPGVFFEANAPKTYFLGKIIPYRGSWVEFEYDTKNLLYVRIDRKRKFLATIFLRALGLKNDAEIVKAFYRIEKVTLKDRKLLWDVSEGLIGNRISKAIENPKTHEAVIPAGRKITAAAYKEIVKAKIAQIEVAAHDLEGACTANDIVDPATGEVLKVEANAEINATNPEHDSCGFADRGTPGFLPRARRCGFGYCPDAEARHHQDAARGPDRALSQDAPRRSADPGDRHVPVQRDVLRSAQIRFLPCRTPEVQHQTGLLLQAESAAGRLQCHGI